MLVPFGDYAAACPRGAHVLRLVFFGALGLVVSAGRVALVRIDGIRTTGMFINDQPVCELEVTVQPRQGQAFRTRMSRRITYVEIPHISPVSCSRASSSPTTASKLRS